MSAVTRGGKQMLLVKKSKLEQEPSMPPICRWCDSEATTERVVIPEDVNRRTKEVRHAAVSADVCAEHAAMIDREYACRELETEIQKVDLKLRRVAPADDKHTNLTMRRAELRDRLLTLQGRVAA